MIYTTLRDVYKKNYSNCRIDDRGVIVGDKLFVETEDGVSVESIDDIIPYTSRGVESAGLEGFTLTHNGVTHVVTK